jgi:putative membrane protein
MLVSLFLGPLIAMSTVLVYSLPSIFLGEAFRANWSFRKLILVPAAVLLSMGLLQLVFANSFASVDFITLGQNVNNELKEAMIESIRQQSIPQEQIDTMIQQLNYSFAQAERMMLSLWFCACSVITYIMAKLVSYIGRRTNTVHRELPPMDTWRMPIWGAGVLAIGIIIIYGLSYIGYDNSLLKDIGMNIAFAGSFICLINGITCLMAVMKTYGVNGFFQFLILFFLYTMSPYGLVFYGIFDMFLDMRARFQKRSL